MGVGVRVGGGSRGWGESIDVSSQMLLCLSTSGLITQVKAAVVLLLAI